MADELGYNEKKSIYYLKNLDCADCARKFEKMIAEVPGVRVARVNFAAAKLEVVGNADLKLIREMGRYEGIEILEENQAEKHGESEWLKFIFPVLSGGALLLGWMMTAIRGETSGVFFLLAIIIGGYRTFQRGIKNLRHLHFDMSVLMSVAVIGALCIGEWLEGATVSFLFAVSELLESYTADKARRSLQMLMELAPKTARVIFPEGTKEIPLEEINPGNEVLVRPGEKIPVDGEVIEGLTGVNQAPITGESVIVEKGPGSEVYAGTINQTGAVRIKVTRRNEDSTFSKILRLVEEAQNNKIKFQSFIERFAAYYTPGVMLLAALIMTLPPLLMGLSWHAWIYRGLALLVVSCPCALVITTPVVVVSAIGNGARNGVLIKGGAHLERLADVTVVAFDKTGTLTEGYPAVKEMISYQNDPQKLLMLAGSVEQYSEHPLARAVVKEAEKQMLPLKTTSAFQAYPGRGAEALVDGDLVRVGNAKFFSASLNSKVLADIREMEQKSLMVILVGTSQEIMGLIAMSDQIRDSAPRATRMLKESLKVRETLMLTGDSEYPARAIQEAAGVDTVYAKLLPEDKVKIIRGLKESGSVVLMVGDGINDAPALAEADVSMAMGIGGTGTALETADLALMSHDLNKIAYVIDLGKKSVRIIKQNVAFAIGIKLLAIIFVFPGWLTLWLAIMADMGANLLVTMNGLRLTGYKFKKQ